MNDKKAETLREIIALAEQHERAAIAAMEISKHNGEYEEATWHNGRLSAFQTIEKQCKAMLGYGGTILLLKDENQAEDAK